MGPGEKERNELRRGMVFTQAVEIKIQNIFQMAKQKGPIKLSGKTGNIVFSKGRYGARAGTAPELTTRQKKEIAARPQNLRTEVLSRFASGLLNAVKYHADVLVPGRFFNNMLSLFRKEPTNHRVLLLQQLREMEVNPNYRFEELCPKPETELIVGKTSYTIEAELPHPAYGDGNTNCFYLDLILFTWHKEDDRCRHEELSTDWMSTAGREPKYCTLKFKRSAKDTEYLLGCRCVTGVNRVENGWTSTAMYFICSGTLTAEGKKILAERKAEIEAARNAPPVKEEVKEKKRVGVRDKK